MFEKYRSEIVVGIAALSLALLESGVIVFVAALCYLAAVATFEKRTDPEAERVKSEIKDLKSKVEQLIIRRNG